MCFFFPCGPWRESVWDAWFKAHMPENYFFFKKKLLKSMVALFFSLSLWFFVFFNKSAEHMDGRFIHPGIYSITKTSQFWEKQTPEKGYKAKIARGWGSWLACGFCPVMLLESDNVKCLMKLTCIVKDGETFVFLNWCTCTSPSWWQRKNPLLICCQPITYE